MNAVIGNLMAALVLWLGQGISLVFWILFGCGCVADLLFLLLKNPKYKSESSAEKKPIKINETLKMFLEPRMLLMTVVLIYSGISQSFFYSRFPQAITGGLSMVGLVMATLGGSDTLASLFMGRLSDVIGKKPVLLFATISGLAAYIITSGLVIPLNETYLFFVVAALMGISDAGYNTQLYSVIGLFHPEKLEPAYAFLKLIQSTTTAIAFIYSLFWDLQQISICMLVSLVLAIISFFVCDLFVAKVDAPKK